ncbi:MAG: ABC transporter ATP-binding protein [Bifidobacteriaceae bacterium]|jgi:ABC-2 type transport system ATP-binding protein|nr:ABC transporter ATP-binding protein [Bifidobacteriaceae bacterium]
MTTPVIDIVHLRKRFGATKALDGLDLRLEQGQVAGFLGPNGAGKSTTIRILLGLLRADGGRARLLGRDPWHDAVALHRRVAYVPGEVALWPGLSGGATIDYLGRLHGGLDQAERDRLLRAFDLDPAKKTRAYSKGNRQKIALIAALAVKADLYLFDEPTSGLDPLMEEVFALEVERLRRHGRSVLLSSHILAEVEKLCDTVTIIRSGRTVESGALSQLRSLALSTVEAVTSADPQGLDRLPGIRDLQVRQLGDRFSVRCAVVGTDIGAVMARLSGLGLVSLTCAPPSLEDLFLRHYSQELALEQPEDADDAAAPGDEEPS